MGLLVTFGSVGLCWAVFVGQLWWVLRGRDWRAASIPGALSLTLSRPGSGYRCAPDPRPAGVGVYHLAHLNDPACGAGWALLVKLVSAGALELRDGRAFAVAEGGAADVPALDPMETAALGLAHGHRPRAVAAMLSRCFAAELEPPMVALGWMLPHDSRRVRASQRLVAATLLCCVVLVAWFGGPILTLAIPPMFLASWVAREAGRGVRRTLRGEAALYEAERAAVAEVGTSREWTCAREVMSAALGRPFALAVWSPATAALFTHAATAAERATADLKPAVAEQRAGRWELRPHKPSERQKQRERALANRHGRWLDAVSLLLCCNAVALIVCSPAEWNAWGPWWSLGGLLTAAMVAARGARVEP